jgi:hypothetical protein
MGTCRSRLRTVTDWAPLPPPDGLVLPARSDPDPDLVVFARLECTPDEEVRRLSPVSTRGPGFCYTLTTASGHKRLCWIDEWPCESPSDEVAAAASERLSAASRRCTQLGKVVTTPSVVARLEAGANRRNALRPSRSDPGPQIETGSAFGSP